MRRFIVATGLGLVLSGCGLFKVNVKSNVKGLGGGSSKSAEPASPSDKRASNGRSSNASSDASQGGSKTEDPARAAKRKEKEDKQNAKKARREMLALVSKVDKHITSQQGAIFTNDIDDLEAKAKALGKMGDAEGKAFARHVAKSYRVENAWRVAESETAPTLEKELKAHVVTQGKLTGKKKPVSFSFDAKAGSCYFALSHLAKDGGDEDRLNRFRFDAGNKNSSLQRFNVDGRRTKGPGRLRKVGKSYLHGVCALESTKVTATAEMQYAGTKNALRYVVLETKRSAFPEYVALDLQVVTNDSCDAANWESLWTQPIPGSVVYGRSAPYLTYDVGHPGELWMTAYPAQGGRARLMRKQIASKPPGNLKFGSDVKFKGCSKKKEHAHSPMAKKVAGCYARLHKKYDRQFDAADHIIDNSPSIVARVHARRRIKQLNAQWDADERRQCKPLQKQARQQWEAAYNRIVDFYGATPYEAPFDRAEAMRLTYLGSYSSR